MGWLTGVPVVGSAVHGARPPRPAVICHRTYGGWAGDLAVITRGGLAHLLIGKQRGQWAQFGPTEARFYHCNGANDAYGIEITGTNDDPFTEWQTECMQFIRPQLRAMLGVPDVYSDGSDGWVNGHTWIGWHAHNRILTDDGSPQHTNAWAPSDFAKIVNLAPPDPVPDLSALLVSRGEGTAVDQVNWANMLNVVTVDALGTMRYDAHQNGAGWLAEGWVLATGLAPNAPVRVDVLHDGNLQIMSLYPDGRRYHGTRRADNGQFSAEQLAA